MLFRSNIIKKNKQKTQKTLLHQKFKQTNQLSILKKITTNITHKLNTPLNNILKFTQLIQNHTNNQQIKQNIKKIINSSIHTQKIIKKLIFFSYKIPQQKQTANIKLLIKKTLQLLHITFKQTTITPQLSLPNHPIITQINPIQFTQIIFNLLINTLHTSTPKQKI